MFKQEPTPYFTSFSGQPTAYGLDDDFGSVDTNSAAIFSSHQAADAPHGPIVSGVSGPPRRPVGDRKLRHGAVPRTVSAVGSSFSAVCIGSPPPFIPSAFPAVPNSHALNPNINHGTGSYRGIGPGISILSTQPLIKMESSAIQDEIAAQEAAARDYRPQLEGPPVGEKVSSQEITEQYAKADPIYVTKTLALPQTYSHYRSVLGDGNCGWRAIGFRYFELLVESGDPQKLAAEHQRLHDLKSYLITIGGFESLYDEMTEETFSLFAQLQSCLADKSTAMALVQRTFNANAGGPADSIIYHLRMLAASWLKGHVEDYQAFILDYSGVDEYSRGQIEAPMREIDELTINLLFSVLVEPAGMVLEIAYLDRTEGAQVNTYRYPNQANGQDPSCLGPMICLLFRPGHYDILYRPAPLEIQVNHVGAFSQRHQITATTTDLGAFAEVDYSPLAMLPGFGGPPPGLAGLGPLSPPLGDFCPSPQSPWLPQATFPDVFAPRQDLRPLAPGPAPPASPEPMPSPLRFSQWQYQESCKEGYVKEPTFMTATFKNSHFNKAHYNNPEFQPEEYQPENDDFCDAYNRAGRKRSTRSSQEED